MLAALATALLTDLTLAVGQMSWKAPHRLVLRAARGTLVLQSMRGAVLLVLLARGLGAEDVLAFQVSPDGSWAVFLADPELPRQLEELAKRTHALDPFNAESLEATLRAADETSGQRPADEL